MPHHLLDTDCHQLPETDGHQLLETNCHSFWTMPTWLSFFAVVSVALPQEKQKIKSTWWQQYMITRMPSGEKRSCHHKTLLPVDCFYFLSQKAAKKTMRMRQGSQCCWRHGIATPETPPQKNDNQACIIWKLWQLVSASSHQKQFRNNQPAALVVVFLWWQCCTSSSITTLPHPHCFFGGLLWKKIKTINGQQCFMVAGLFFT